MRATLNALDPDVPPFLVRSMQTSLDLDVAEPRLPMVLTVGFASLAALLAALGLLRDDGEHARRAPQPGEKDLASILQYQRNAR